MVEISSFISSISLVSIIFYTLSIFLLVSATAAISVRNPVYSILLLIVSFFSSAGLFILLGAEFIAMLLVIVYVGAVAVLFLFVVMMIKTNPVSLWQSAKPFKYTIFFISTALAIEVVLFVKNWGSFLKKTPSRAQATGYSFSSVEEIGRVLYTEYFYFFQMSGLILLIAMVGAIVLTLRKENRTKRQSISRQLDRTKENSLRLEKPEIGKGI